MKDYLAKATKEERTQFIKDLTNTYFDSNHLEVSFPYFEQKYGIKLDSELKDLLYYCKENRLNDIKFASLEKGPVFSVQVMNGDLLDIGMELEVDGSYRYYFAPVTGLDFYEEAFSLDEALIKHSSKSMDAFILEMASTISKVNEECDIFPLEDFVDRYELNPDVVDFVDSVLSNHYDLYSDFKYLLSGCDIELIAKKGSSTITMNYSTDATVAPEYVLNTKTLKGTTKDLDEVMAVMAKTTKTKRAIEFER